jgi:hypothetical protein
MAPSRPSTLALNAGRSFVVSVLQRHENRAAHRFVPGSTSVFADRGRTGNAIQQG